MDSPAPAAARTFSASVTRTTKQTTAPLARPPAASSPIAAFPASWAPIGPARSTNSKISAATEVGQVSTPAAGLQTRPILRHQSEHRTQVRSPQISGRSVQQPVVQYHQAAIRILPAVPQIVQNRFRPTAAARGRSQLENRPAPEVTRRRTAEHAGAV